MNHAKYIGITANFDTRFQFSGSADQPGGLRNLRIQPGVY